MMPATKELLGDDRVWFVAGSVQNFEGEDVHYDVMDEGPIMVNVVTHTSQTQIPAILKGGDDDGSGVWTIPAVGTEVLVAFSDGDYEGDPYIFAIVGAAPATLVPGVVVIRGKTQILVESPETQIRTIGGTAVSLAKLSELESLADHYYNHAHTGNGTSLPVDKVTTTPQVDPGRTGTTALKGE